MTKQSVTVDLRRFPVTESKDIQDSWLEGGVGKQQKPWRATFNALLNLLERFWKALRPESSTTASSCAPCKGGIF